MANAKPTALVSCVEYGSPTKVYFERQFREFDTVRPVVACWRNEAKTDEIDARQLPSAWETDMERRTRRALSMVGINDTFGTRGAELKALKHIVQDVDAKCIYAHTGFVGVRLAPLKRATGLPMAVHFHGLDININRPAYLKALERNLPHFDRIVICADWMRPFFRARGVDEARMRTVPMGAPAVRLAAEGAPKSTEPPFDGVSFVFVGRLIPYKAVDKVIDAFAALAADMPNVRYTVIGDGPELPRLKAHAAASSAAEKIHFTGPVPSDAALAAIGASDVFVHCPTDEPDGPECFPTTVCEAMAVGKPVIGSICGGIPDQIEHEHTGLLVPQGDQAALVDAMRTMATREDLRQSFGVNGQASACEKLDSAKLAKRAEAVLLELID